MPPPTSITLTLKVPPGYLSATTATDTFTLGQLPTTTTIGAVRHRIQALIPSHPAPPRQRLLYAGRALVDNAQTLADALNTKRDASQEVYVVHLLVKPEGGGGEAVGVGGHQRGGSLPAPAGTSSGPLQLPGDVQLQAPGGAGVAAATARAGMPGLGQGVQFGQQQRAMHGGDGVNGTTPQQQTTTGETPQPATEGTTPQLHPPQPQHPHPRPTSGQGFHLEGVGPNGQRFQIHQQVHNFPAAMPGQGMPFGMPGIPGMPAIPGFPGGFGMPAGIPGVMPTGIPGMPAGIPGIPPTFGMPPNFTAGYPPHFHPQNHAQAQAQAHPNTAPSALDRARQNMAEMRRMLDEMHASAGEDAAQRARVADLRARMGSVGGYIDPLGLHHNVTETEGVVGGSRSAPPAPVGRGAAAAQAVREGSQGAGRAALFAGAGVQQVLDPGQPQQGQGQGQQQPSPSPPPPPSTQASAPHPPPHLPNPAATFFTNNLRSAPFQNNNFPRPAATGEVACYLLSSPLGPQALLLSPVYGAFRGGSAGGVGVGVGGVGVGGGGGGADAIHAYVDESAAAAHGGGEAPNINPAPENPAAAAAAAAQNPAAPAAAPAPAPPAGPAQALANNFWLFLRVLVFAYFILGSNVGWQRPLGGGVVGGWWEGVVGAGGAGGVGGEGVVGGVRGQGVGGERGGGEGGGGGGGGRQMPTPEQVAQRLLDERRALRGTGVRRVLRQVERGGALFVASLWPGVGEAAVRAREAAEARGRREVAEAEAEAEAVAARGREEEEARGRAGGVEGEVDGGEKEGAKASVERGDGDGQTAGEGSEIPVPAAGAGATSEEKGEGSAAST
ncbi:hypothetical protein LTR08_006383 [Meristemomyces frigidus]|nr:hypothetical protein LTR08_006383 [Meristemomyces frigidus]